MLISGSRDDEQVNLPLQRKTNTQIGVNKRSWRILHPVKSFSMMKMFEKCHSLERCGSTLITIPLKIFRGSLNGLNIYAAAIHLARRPIVCEY